MANTQHKAELEKTTVTAPKKKKKKAVRRIAGVVFIGILTIGLGAAGWAAKTGFTMYEQTDITKLSQEPPQSLRIYDANQKLITELTNSRMEYIPLSDFPENLKNAIIAVEDSRFYEHGGIDFKGLSRAMYTNLRNGDVVQGGSTITQQLAKVMLFSSEQTLERKVNEAVAALKIEKNYNKDQILELYLNYIYYGRGAWGIERASQTYFDKNASKLTLAEAALLAGLPKSPNVYSPLNNIEKAKERRDLVLSLMADQGKITAEQKNEAQSEPIKLTDQSSLAATNKYPSYVDHVIEETLSKTKLSEQEILSSGLQIYTNLDPAVQDAAEAVYMEKKNFPGDKGGLQSSVIVLDSKTGAIRGLVGSRSEKREFRAFNYATQLQRQPGSTIKPVVVYTPALLAGFKPQDLINDVETEFGNSYKPGNSGQRFHGWVTMETALMQSYNVPAVALMKEVGIGKAMDFGRKAGLPLEDDDRVYGLALGGLKYGTSPLVMAQAYTMYANNGKLSKAYAVSKIVDRSGNVILQEKPQTNQIIDANTAYTMTQMMQKVVTDGTGRSARIKYPVAGKTGTTQLPDVAEFRTGSGKVINGMKDAWFVGYTPELVTAVWVGYPVTNREHYIPSEGGTLPGDLFGKVMSGALKNRPVTAFQPPKGYRLAGGKIQRINGEEDKLYASADDSSERRRSSGKADSPIKKVDRADISSPSPTPTSTPAKNDGTANKPDKEKADPSNNKGDGGGKKDSEGSKDKPDKDKPDQTDQDRPGKPGKEEDSPSKDPVKPDKENGKDKPVAPEPVKTPTVKESAK
ncbi:transglycosylase domain-containing protein [Paenibacillus sp. FJAT-26967]|uniref:transglycosylase domain-containing protein n=1 Tax=Paenibacillus sp. FJAT-26967 TaxID=1729690 RepID=UPI000838AF3B|nr:PBP1A family penicillin-binding protein [Paenibacillus sp. FJAT-26967]